MSGALDLAGMRFGRLTAIEFVDTRNRRRRWCCVCDCGGEKVATVGDLRGGGVTSCGCRQREVWQAIAAHAGDSGHLTGAINGRKRRRFKAATLDRQYADHQRGGRARELGFLSRQEWESVVLRPCHYCGSLDRRTTTNSRRQGHADDEVSMVGVDRVDSSLPYALENCVPCCGRCNRAKGPRSADEFIAWIEAVYLHTRRSR